MQSPVSVLSGSRRAVDGDALQSQSGVIAALIFMDSHPTLERTSTAVARRPDHDSTWTHTLTRYRVNILDAGRHVHLEPRPKACCIAILGS